MADSSADRDPFDRLAEEFVARYRAGERPSVTEYANRHPELAEEVRDLLPALVEMEQLKPVTADHAPGCRPATGPADPVRVGEFRILRRVGTGGMGVVYEAVQESLGRHVALKLLPIDALADPKRLERFRREAKAAAKLHHTNIVPVFGTGEADGRHFYAMQFIAGHPLDTVIDEVRRLKDKSAPAVERAMSEVAAALVSGTFARLTPAAAPTVTLTHHPGPALSGTSSGSIPAMSGSLSDSGRHYWATVARVGAQVADALAYAHAQGVLHRDIKPSNLLLDLKGTVWVTDFGLAKATETDDLTQEGDFIGTIRYMAPERFDGAGDGRSDTYALGLTLYEMLTLKPAFQAETRAKLVEQVVAASPKPPRTVNPAIPRDLETIVLKAIQRDPAMRYQTASELADDLRRFTEDRPIRARRASASEQVWRWCRRNPAVASLMTTIAVLLAIVAVVGTVAAARFKDRADVAVKARKDADDARKQVGVQLWRSQLSEARANTRSGLPGQRFQSIALLRKALAAARESGLTDEDRKQFRDVAVSALALPDLEVVKEWVGASRDTQYFAIDARFERYARTTESGAVSVRRVEDDAELYSFPPTGKPVSISLSDSGKVLATCDDSIADEAKRTGRIYRLDGPAPVLLHESPMRHGTCVFIGPDDNQVVNLLEGRVTVWHADTGRTESWPTPGSINGSAALSRDGRRLAVTCATDKGNCLHVRDVATGTATDLLLPNRAENCSWHPSGRIVAMVSGTKVFIWDVEKGREIITFEGHPTGGPDVAFDDTGDRLFTNDWWGIQQIWDWRAGKQILKMPVTSFISARRVSTDGRQFVRGIGEGKLWIMRPYPGLERRQISPSRTNGFYLVIDPVGELVAWSYSFGNGNLVTVTDASERYESGQFAGGLSDAVAFQFTADGSLMTYGGHGIIRWPRAKATEQGVVRFGPPQRLRGGAARDTHSASPDGRLVAYPRYNFGTEVIRTDRVGFSFSLGPQGDVRATVISPDSRFVATGTHSGEVEYGAKVWDAQTGTLVAEFQGRHGPPRFSPDSRWLVTQNGKHLWRTDTRTDGPAIPDADTVSFFAFSPDSRVLAVDGHAVVRLIRLEDGVELVRLPFPDQARYEPQCFSADGGSLYVLNQETREVFAWDVRRLRAGLAELGLDWDEPPLPPARPVTPVSRVEFVGAELLADPTMWAEHERQVNVLALASNPFDVAAAIRLGVIQLDTRPDAALGLFNRALALDPTREDARLHRARAYVRLGNYDRAVDDATFVLDRYPTQMIARNVRALAYRQLDRYVDAAADLTELLRIHPTEVSPLIDRAGAYRAAGDEEKAMADLRRADELAGGASATATNNLAWHLVTGPPATRNPKRALELITKVVAGQSGNAVFLNTLGVCQYRNGLYQEAAKTLEKSLAVGKGDYAYDLYFLAMCYHKLEDKVRAKDCYDRAVKWLDQPREKLTAVQRQELDEFRAEAAALGVK